jgi:predicted metal-binding membrane protein
LREQASARLPGSVAVSVSDGALVRVWMPLALLATAAVGWWWSIRMAADMTGMGAMGEMGAMSLGAFLVGWAAMMAAMMLPAVLPVVRLYGQAATAGRAAPVIFFAAGYLAVWSLTGLPGYLAWRALDAPLAEGQHWAARLAGAVLLVAAAWQLTPLKSVCLRHCRSPLGFFLRFGGRIGRPSGAIAMGVSHSGFCVGCCWALFAVLVAVGTMNIAWMIALTILIVLERNAPGGEWFALAGAAVLAVVGAALMLDPALLPRIT